MNTTTQTTNPSSDRESTPGLRSLLQVTVTKAVPKPAADDASTSQTADSPPATTKSEAEEQSFTLDFIASNESLDRCGEIITASGWRLERYRRNPVFQNAHQYGDVLFTLGKALITEVRDGALYQRVRFAVEANPMARIAYALYQGGFLNAVSVGFIPVRWENGTDKSGYRRKYLEQELLEVSAVAIPANPDALRLGFEAGAVNRADLRAAADLLSALAARGAHAETTTHSICSQAAPGGADTRAAGPASASDWLRLARRFREVMRR